MSTPTDQQQIRATIRRHERKYGTGPAAALAIGAALDVLDVPALVDAAREMLPGYVDEIPILPDLMGTAEVAAAFGIANSNISKLPPAVRPIPCQRISNGTTPVYLASEVMAKAAQYRPRTRA